MERKLKIQERYPVYGTKLARKKVRPMNYRFKLHNHVRKTDGKVKLNLFVTHSGKSETIPISNVLINPNKWNKKKQRLNARVSEDIDVNAVLDQIEEKILQIKNKYAIDNSILTAEKFVEEYLYFNANIDFLVFMDVQVEREKDFLKKATYLYYFNVLKKLKNWKKEIIFKEINDVFFEDYTAYCKSLGNQTNTISRNIRAIKKYLKKALKKGIKINIDLEDVKTKQINSTRNDLSISEVRLLLQEFYKNQLPFRAQQSLGLFLFSCFTGLRWNELNNFSLDNIYKKYIVIWQEKTENPLRIPLTLEASDIAEAIDWNRKISYQCWLKYLKEAALLLGFNKKISFHVGRHTFATNYMRTNGNVVKLMVLLGHKKISTTQIYVHMTGMEQDDHIHKLSNLYAIGSGL
ncbi:tyrosine-type recombinase/integrase [Chishuiella sp.]|uniref:tyrosine-type recombinase/integrase n=1 Tax=Chishuiella sp. TaxID=1969467 RepID=UPI0028AF438E|nr:tyrosine-type recombinase/integrase [Chishuiella sp.]